MANAAGSYYAQLGLSAAKDPDWSSVHQAAKNASDTAKNVGGLLQNGISDIGNFAANIKENVDKTINENVALQHQTNKVLAEEELQRSEKAKNRQAEIDAMTDYYKQTKTAEEYEKMTGMDQQNFENFVNTQLEDKYFNKSKKRIPGKIIMSIIKDQDYQKILTKKFQNETASEEEKDMYNALLAVTSDYNIMNLLNTREELEVKANRLARGEYTPSQAREYTERVRDMDLQEVQSYQVGNLNSAILPYGGDLKPIANNLTGGKIIDEKIAPLNIMELYKNQLTKEEKEALLKDKNNGNTNYSNGNTNYRYQGNNNNGDDYGDNNLQDKQEEDVEQNKLNFQQLQEINANVGNMYKSRIHDFNKYKQNTEVFFDRSDANAMLHSAAGIVDSTLNWAKNIVSENPKTSAAIGLGALVFFLAGRKFGFTKGMFSKIGNMKDKAKSFAKGDKNKEQKIDAALTAVDAGMALTPELETILNEYQEHLIGQLPNDQKKLFKEAMTNGEASPKKLEQLAKTLEEKTFRSQYFPKMTDAEWANIKKGTSLLHDKYKALSVENALKEMHKDGIKKKELNAIKDKFIEDFNKQGISPKVGFKRKVGSFLKNLPWLTIGTGLGVAGAAFGTGYLAYDSIKRDISGIKNNAPVDGFKYMLDQEGGSWDTLWPFGHRKRSGDEKLQEMLALINRGSNALETGNIPGATMETNGAISYNQEELQTELNKIDWLLEKVKYSRETIEPKQKHNPSIFSFDNLKDENVRGFLIETENLLEGYKKQLENTAKFASGAPTTARQNVEQQAARIEQIEAKKEDNAALQKSIDNNKITPESASAIENALQDKDLKLDDKSKATLTKVVQTGNIVPEAKAEISVVIAKNKEQIATKTTQNFQFTRKNYAAAVNADPGSSKEAFLSKTIAGINNQTKKFLSNAGILPKKQQTDGKIVEDVLEDTHTGIAFKLTLLGMASGQKNGQNISYNDEHILRDINWLIGSDNKYAVKVREALKELNDLYTNKDSPSVNTNKLNEKRDAINHALNDLFVNNKDRFRFIADDRKEGGLTARGRFSQSLQAQNSTYGIFEGTLAKLYYIDKNINLNFADPNVVSELLGKNDAKKAIESFGRPKAWDKYQQERAKKEAEEKERTKPKKIIKANNKGAE